MLATIRGQIILKKDNALIIEVAGLGYKVFVPNELFETLAIGADVFLYLYHSISETAQTLYGFNVMEEKEFFELLLTISGIGPKVALNILNAATLDELRAAVIEGEPAILTNISGIGSKTAQRIVLELKNKITISDVRPIGTKSIDVGSHTDAYEALIKLGYSPVEARAALKMIPASVKDTKEKIKQALKNLVK